AYTGNGKTAIGEAFLDGTSVSVTGNASAGLMAGDTDDGTDSAGNITFKNANVSVDGVNSIAARAYYGSVLNIENAALTANGGTGRAKGVVAEGGSTVTITGGSISTTGGMNSHAIDSYEAGSVITTNGVNVST